MPEALAAQFGEGYDYGGVSDLEAKMAAGKDLSAYNREQQGDIVADYFVLREEMETYQNLAEYTAIGSRRLGRIHLLRPGSLHAECGTSLMLPTRPRSEHGSGNPLKNAGDIMQRGSTGRTTSTPVLSNVNQVTDVARDAAFAQLPSKPGDMTVIASNRMESLNNGKPERGKPSASSSLSPVSESALDVVFDSIA